MATDNNLPGNGRQGIIHARDCDESSDGRCRMFTVAMDGYSCVHNRERRRSCILGPVRPRLIQAVGAAIGAVWEGSFVEYVTY